MTKRIRLIILIVCAVCFLTIAPALILYSIGDRFDFAKMKVTSTGGIYVRTFPVADQITTDAKNSKKPGIFSNSIFVQSLLPGYHSVLVKKTGYYDYLKTIPVQEKQVTKLENIILIKKSIDFTSITEKATYFSVAPNNRNIIFFSEQTKGLNINYTSLDNSTKLQTIFVAQTGFISDIQWSNNSVALIKINNKNNIIYYLFQAASDQPVVKKASLSRLSYLDKNSKQISFSPQDPETIFYLKDSTLFSAKKDSALPTINNVLAYHTSGTNITWLSSKGVLANSDLSGKFVAKVLEKELAVDSKKSYKLFSVSGKTFLQENDILSQLDQNKKIFVGLDLPLKGYEFFASPDNKNLIFVGKNDIYLYILEKEKFEKLYSGAEISQTEWMNNDYIIFTDKDSIIISEIDYRGDINTITLPSPISLSADNKIEIKNPKIYFNRQENNLYILTEKNILQSEKLIP